MEEILNAVLKLGFPVALSIFLLTRQENRMIDLIESIKGRGGLIDKIDDLIKALDKKV